MKNSNLLETLSVLRDGKVLSVADHFLSQCATAVCICENPKARGKFTISLTLKSSASGGGSAVTANYSIRHESPTKTGKESELTEGEEVLLVSPDGNLSRAQAPSLGLFSYSAPEESAPESGGMSGVEEGREDGGRR